MLQLEQASLITNLIPPFILFYNTGLSLFLKKKHIIHRIGGLTFLIQYIISWYLCIFHYDYYINSYFVITLPINGCIQAISAILSFHRLPNKQNNPGRYREGKKVTSYQFIQENLFYQILALQGMFYFNNGLISHNNKLLFNEIILVFLPYHTIRQLFPKTSFTDALNDNKSKFYFYGIWLIKIFYLISKHFIGYFFNYLRFMDKLNNEELKIFNIMLLANVGTVSIAIFLNTLKIKGILSGKVEYTIYLFMAYAPLMGFFKLYHLFIDQYVISIICAIGLLLNLTRNNKLTYVYQILIAALFYSNREHDMSLF